MIKFIAIPIETELFNICRVNFSWKINGNVLKANEFARTAKRSAYGFVSISECAGVANPCHYTYNTHLSDKGEIVSCPKSLFCKHLRDKRFRIMTEKFNTTDE